MATQRLAGAVAALLLLSTGACHSPEAPSPPLPHEDKLQYTFRWIANPSLDLMSPEGTFVRAISESYDNANYADGRGRVALAEKGYPGFEHAENNVWDSADIGGATNPQVGTDYREVVDFRRDGARYTAIVCSYWGGTASKQSDGTYIGRGFAPVGSAYAYTFGPDTSLAPDQQHLPPAQQRGPARRPSDNVFGTWLLFDQPHVSNDQESACHRVAPGTSEGMPDPYKRSDPPPTLSPDPGWPEGSSA